jgi:SPP1 gp7 family putative phage head morphogenesis protein
MTTKAMPDILYDTAFWREQRDVVLKVVRPLFVEAFLVGAALGARERPRRVKDVADPVEDALSGSYLPFDFDAIQSAAEEVVSSYTNDWWAKLEQTTRERMRRIIGDASEQALGVAEVSARIEPLFGPERAMRIAVTELTNLMGEGARETYRRAGFSGWLWRTVRDAHVDPICEARDGALYPMSQAFAAAHPGCRCWPVPAGSASPEAALAAGRMVAF